MREGALFYAPERKDAGDAIGGWCEWEVGGVCRAAQFLLRVESVTEEAGGGEWEKGEGDDEGERERIEVNKWRYTWM